MCKRALNDKLIFRPGFGDMSFRRDSMAATLYGVEHGSTGDQNDDGDSDDNNNSEEDNNAVNSGPAAGFGGPIDMFLAGLGLQEYIRVFRKQKIDLETLMSLNHQDLMEMKIEIGPRKKILKAIQERKEDMDKDDAIEDSRL